MAPRTPSRALIACLAAACLRAAPAAAAAGPDAWLLGYEGRSTNEAMSDRRGLDVIRRHVPADAVKLVTNGLSGPPDPVRVDRGGDVTLSACFKGFCPMKVLLWVDTRTGIGLAAVWGDERFGETTVRLLTRDALPRGVPDAAAAAVLRWLAAENLRPARILLTDASDREREIPLAEFGARPTDVGTVEGPSFRCGEATSEVERAICADADLARLDRELAHAFAVARGTQGDSAGQALLVDFQRAWLARRDRDCRAGKAVDPACLGGMYRAQLHRLRNWAPNGS